MYTQSCNIMIFIITKRKAFYSSFKYFPSLNELEKSGMVFTFNHITSEAVEPEASLVYRVNRLARDQEVKLFHALPNKNKVINTTSTYLLNLQAPKLFWEHQNNFSSKQSGQNNFS